MTGLVWRASLAMLLVVALVIVATLPITRTVTERLPEFAQTFVVGIAGTAEAAEADYICDGTDDHIQINQAIDDLPAGGGKVELLAGTFTIGGNVSMDSNVALAGQGMSTIIKLKDSYDASINLIENSDPTGGNGNITVSDLMIDGNKDNNSGGIYLGISFEKVGSGNDTFAEGGALITNVHIREVWHSAIYLNECYNSIVSDCVIREGNENIVLAECGYCVISDNVLMGATNGEAIYLATNTSYCTIVGNICEGASFPGIWIGSGATSNLIQGNVCLDNGHAGIKVSAAGNTIVGNLCHDNTQSGISIETAAATNVFANNCVNNGWYGIFVSNADYSSIVGNVVNQNQYYGIFCINTDHAIVSGNHCSEDSQMTDDTYDEIQLNTCDYCTVSNNVCRRGAQTNQPRYGIRINESASDKNMVHGNNLYDSGDSGDFDDNGTGTLACDNVNNAGTGWVTETP